MPVWDGRLTGNIWSCTTVGATSHAHDNRVIADATFLADFLDFIDQNRKILVNGSMLMKIR